MYSNLFQAWGASLVSFKAFELTWHMLTNSLPILTRHFWDGTEINSTDSSFKYCCSCLHLETVYRICKGYCIQLQYLLGKFLSWDNLELPTAHLTARDNDGNGGFRERKRWKEVDKGVFKTILEHSPEVSARTTYKWEYKSGTKLRTWWLRNLHNRGSGLAENFASAEL